MTSFPEKTARGVEGYLEHAPSRLDGGGWPARHTAQRNPLLARKKLRGTLRAAKRWRRWRVLGDWKGGDTHEGSL